MGSKKLTDTINVNGEEITIGKLVLSPTRSYLPVMQKVFSVLKGKIDGIIHCTGGGQTKVVKFVDNVKVIKDNLFDVPPLFEMIQKESGTAWKEMYQVFNMGQRMEFYLDEKYAQEIIDISNSFNIDAKIIGRVVEAPKAEVEITTAHGTFNYFT